MNKFAYVLIVLMGMMSSAVAEPRYETDIRVDVTAENVTVAKEQAMAKAIRQGVSDVLQSISTEASVKELNTLNDNQLQHFVNGVTVLMEKSSTVRYIAELRISVNEAVLKEYMEENHMPLVVSGEQDVLVVPLIEYEDGTLDLWGDDNVWRQAFVERPHLQKGNLRIHNIDKNLGNITTVRANRVYDMSDGEYIELMDFNRGDSLYVLKYSLKDKKVYIKVFPEQEVNEIDILGKKPSELIDDCLIYFKDNKKDNLVEDESFVNERIDVIYTYRQLAQWTALKKILEDNSQVSNISIISMGGGKVHFSFDFNGVIEKLQASLDVQGFQLRNEGEYYAIY